MKPQKNRFIAIITASVALTLPAFAASGVWDTTTSGADWTLNTNWVGSVIADGSGSTADFNQVDIAGATTVNLNGNRTIGNLIFGDTNTGSAGSWILAGGSDVLTLAGATPTITVNALEQLGDYGASATISAGLAGTSGLTKEGAGRLILAGGTANTFSGPITVNAGMLGSLDSASLQNVAGAITVASGATFDAKALFGANITNNFTLSGTGFGSNYGTVYGALNIRENANLTGTITLAADTLITHDWNIAYVNASITGTNTNLELQTLQPSQYGFYLNSPISLGTGALTLTGVGTSGSPDFAISGANSFTGGTLLKGGRVTFNNASALGNGPVTFVSDTSLTATAGMTHANALTVNSGIAATLEAAASTTLDQSGAVTGDGTLTKSGLGTVTLSGGVANTFSGPINVDAGMLGSLNSASLQNLAGTVTVASGATFDAKALFGANIANNFSLSGTGSGISNYGALNIRENANLTGAIALADHTKITHDWNVANVNGSITGTDTNLELKTLQAGQYGFFVGAPISLGTGALTLTGIGTSGSADFNFSGTNSFTGGTLLNGGRVSINNGSALGSGIVTFMSDTSLEGTASLTHANALTVNSGVAATLAASASTTFEQSGAVTGTGTLTKSGLGTVTLSGGVDNTFSGPITVNTGLLGSLNSASLQNVTAAITVASGASFDAKAGFGANITNNFTLSGNGSGINNYGALNIRENANLSGAITLATDTRITHDWNIATISGSITGTNTNLELQTLQTSQYGFVISGPISLGTGALTLNGVGTIGDVDFKLTSPNSYTGTTTVIGGTLSLGNGTTNTSLADTAGVVIGTDPTATLNLNYTGTDNVASLTINGVVKPAGVYSSSDPSGRITGTGTLTVGAVVSPYTTWANAFLPGNNVSNPAGDNDNDGLVNQQEFAFGLSPISGSSVNPILVQLNKTTGQFSYQRRAGSGLTYKILTSTTLATGSWTEDLTAGQVAGATDGNGNQTVVVTLTGAPLAASKLFVRVAAN